jgi:hypothetical protein
MLQIAYKRLRLMLQGGYETGGGTLRTYLNANIWHDFSAEQTVRFANNPIVRETKGTSLELAAGSSPIWRKILVLLQPSTTRQILG